ncbi:MAG: peptidoglycan-binding protein [Microcoleus sp. SIO2G3]|nr:peptidoglycan-binding protein [Microcoleus sp. SIO2G3]
METLAYLHLALANETPTDNDYIASISMWESINLYEMLKPQKLSTRATYSLLSFTIALGILGTATQTLALVQEGSRGSQVTAIQQRLQQLGYFKANITGYFGSQTKEAVIRFQQAKGLTPDGVVGTSTETALRGQPTPRPQTVRVPFNGVLRLGDRGDKVSLLQESLAAAGYCSGSRGVFDSRTQAAVRQFQQARGLTADGVVGPQTRAALPAIGGSEPTPTSANATRVTATTRFDTRSLQRRLQAQGFYRGAIDGIWGPQTQAAVEAAQRAYRVSTSDIKTGRF